LNSPPRTITAFLGIVLTAAPLIATFPSKMAFPSILTETFSADEPFE
jgi:hypothetical protein